MVNVPAISYTFGCAGSFQAAVCAIVANEEVGLLSDQQMKLSHVTSGSSDSTQQQCTDVQKSLAELHLEVRSGTLVSCLTNTAEARSVRSMLVAHKSTYSFAEACGCDSNPFVCNRSMHHA
jgi:hypothetical protein